MKIKTKNLSNNLPLYYLKTQKAPVVTMQVWVKTGSADELKHEAGLSHFIEHLVFKGTDNYKPGDIARVVEGAGGELNAYTSFDQTVFYVTVPKENIEVAAQVLHEMVSCPHFDPVEVDREREVVVEEIKRGFDQPSRVASQFLFTNAFKGYNYELPVIGTEENIRRVPVQEIRDYFEERYCASNMALVCVGDIEEDELEALSEKYFAKVPSKPKQKRDRKRGSVNLESKDLFFKKTDFEKTFFYYTWKAENLQHKDSNAYEVLALLLGQGESSHLYRDLKLQKNLCQSIGSFYYAGKDEGVFVVSGTCMPEKLDELTSEIPKSIEAFLERDDLNIELNKARNIFSSEEYYARESVSSLCRQIGDDWLYYNDIEKTEKKLEAIMAVDLDEVKRVLLFFLNQRPKLTLLSKGSVDEKKLVESIDTISNLKSKEISWALQSDESRLDKKSSSKTNYEKEKIWQTKAGNKIIYIPQTESEVCSVKFGLPGGELLSTNEQQGLISLFGRVWGRASQSRSEHEQAALLDYYCSSFSSFSGKHSIGLSLMTLTKFFDDLSVLFKENLFTPVFDPSLVEREKQILLAQLKSRKDHPASVLFKNFSSGIFKNSIYARDSIGVIDQIEKITAKDLEDFYENHRSNFSLSFVGNLTSQSLENFVESIDKTERFDQKFSFDREKFETSLVNPLEELDEAKAQTHIVIGFKGLKYDDGRKDVLDVINSVLGGQGGRLFIELRDKESLAYSVAPIDYAGVFDGYFGAYIACDPSKKDKAIQMMREELQKLRDNGVSDEELRFAKNQSLGRRAMALQKNSYIADTVLFDTIYGIDSLNYRKYNDRINAVSEKNIVDVLTEILNGEEFLFTC